MSQTTVRRLAELVNMPVENFVASLSDVGIVVGGPDHVVTSLEKLKILGWMRGLNRDPSSEASIPVTLNHIQDDLEIEPEFEEDFTAKEISRPYDPTLIRVEPKMFSLRNILDMIDEGEIDIAPDFQRLQVWSPQQKSRLIESVLLRIPLPAFYFASDSEGKLQVVDGVQRLSTIFDFVRGDKSFPLVQLEYLMEEVGGKRFPSLKGSVWAKRINSTQIVANVIDAQTPTQVKFDIFKRINTGGTPLNSQEIRHCMSRAPSRALLKRLTSTEEFSNATGGSLSANVRMADREMALRVIAFATLGLDRYYQTVGLDQFLNDATQAIDSNLLPAPVDLYEFHFNRAMRLGYELFGEHCFRKWPTYTDRRLPINRAIFEAVGTTLLLTPENALKSPREIQDGFRDLCTNDSEFISYVTQSTSSPGSVAGRFEKIEKVLIA